MDILKRFTIHNVLSIEDLTLNFQGAGVYHISGANNIGKTTIIRAMDAHFNNIANNQYKDLIRDDCDHFETESEDINGNIVHLSRGAVDYYEWWINGEHGRLDNTSGKVPDVLKKYFNLYIDEHDKEDLNIRYKDDKTIFTKTSSQANYRYLEKALGTEVYSKAFKVSTDLKKQLVADNKVNNQYLIKEQDVLTNLQAKGSNVQAKLDSLGQIKSTIDSSMEVYNFLGKFKSNTDDLMDLMTRAKTLSGGLANFNLDGLSQDLETLKALNKVNSSYQEANRFIARKKDLEPVANIEIGNYEDSFTVIKLLDDLQSEFNEIDLLSKKVDHFAKIDESLNTDDINTNLGIMEDLANAKNAVEDGFEIKQRVDLAQTAYDDSVKALDDFMDDFDVCPFCGQTMPEGGVHTHASN